MNYTITRAEVEGRAMFEESIFVRRFEGTEYEETYEIVGATFEFDHPAFPTDDEEGSYFFVREIGYHLTKKGQRPKGKQATTLNVMNKAALDDLGDSIRARFDAAGVSS